MNLRLSLPLFALFTLSSAAPAQVIDLEDVTIPPAGFYNGSDGAGGFTSRGAGFNNSYNTTFGAWSGWSSSRITNVTTPGFGNQYAAYNLPGSGTGDGSPTYAVAFTGTPTPTINLPANTRPLSARITNTTYAALSMRDGDPPPNIFAKKFGGPTGNDPDFFRLTVQGFNAVGVLTGSIDFYLADYRFSNNAQDYILSQWTNMDLTPLGPATRLTFDLTSSDVGQFGMNTPAYFALDNLTVTAVPEPGTLVLTALGAIGLVVRRKRKIRP